MRSLDNFDMDFFFQLIGLGVAVLLVIVLLDQILGGALTAWRRGQLRKPDEQPIPSTPDEPIVIYTGTFVDASQLKGELEKIGIPAFIWDQSASSLVPLDLYVRVAVGSRDVERAKPILESFRTEKL